MLMIFFAQPSYPATQKGFLWNIEKAELSNSKQSLKNFKKGNYSLARYYFNKISNRYLKGVLVHLYSATGNQVKIPRQTVTKYLMLTDGTASSPKREKPFFTREQVLQFLNIAPKESSPPLKNEDIDWLLWNSRLAEAEAQLKRLDRKHKDYHIYRLRLALQRKKEIGQEDSVLIKNHLYSNAGLTHDYIMWMVKHDNRYLYAPQLLLSIPDDMHQQYRKKWWYLSKRCLREIIYNQDYDHYLYAYQLAKMHRMHGDKKEFAEGEWLAGWIAIEFLDKPKVAHEHFVAFYENVSKPLSLSRAAYWLARSSPNRAEMIKWYERAAQYPTTFYGQVAIYEMGYDIRAVLSQYREQPVYDFSKLKNNKYAQYLYIFSLLEENMLSNFMVKCYISKLEDVQEAQAFLRLAAKSGAFYGMVSIAKELESRLGSIILDYLYPVAYSDVHSLPINPALTLAIIRQESRFDHQAISRAGAHGLMQLIPKTAASTALQLGERYAKEDIFSPAYNMALGSNHMHHQIRYYRNSLILAIASYNAGSHNVDKWVKKLGNPRDLQDMRRVLLWMEMIPFQETRDYVQYVFSNLQVYRYLLAHEGDIARDLITTS